MKSSLLTWKLYERRGFFEKDLDLTEYSNLKLATFWEGGDRSFRKPDSNHQPWMSERVHAVSSGVSNRSKRSVSTVYSSRERTDRWWTRWTSANRYLPYTSRSSFEWSYGSLKSTVLCNEAVYGTFILIGTTIAYQFLGRTWWFPWRWTTTAADRVWSERRQPILKLCSMVIWLEESDPINGHQRARHRKNRRHSGIAWFQKKSFGPVAPLSIM